MVVSYISAHSCDRPLARDLNVMELPHYAAVTIPIFIWDRFKQLSWKLIGTKCLFGLTCSHALAGFRRLNDRR